MTRRPAPMGLLGREPLRSRRALLSPPRGDEKSARHLFISDKTVRYTVSSICAKLHAAGRAEAIITAREAGFGRDRPRSFRL